jgi:hypothetical protein
MEAEDSNDIPHPLVPYEPPITTTEALDIFSRGLTYLYQQGGTIGISSADISIVRKISNAIKSYEIRQHKQSQLEQFFIH